MTRQSTQWDLKEGGIQPAAVDIEVTLKQKKVERCSQNFDKHLKRIYSVLDINVDLLNGHGVVIQISFLNIVQSRVISRLSKV